MYVANRLQDEHPHILSATVGHAEFEGVLGKLTQQLPDEKPHHFYCRPCGEYHLKTHPHQAAMRKRQTKARIAALKK